MRGVVVIEFWKKLGRNWCFVVYSGGRQPKNIYIYKYILYCVGRVAQSV